MQKTTCFILVILFAATLSANNITNTTAKKPLSCHLADASLATSDYFVTGNLIYLATVNLVMPILAGFVLPIVLGALMRRANPDMSLPGTIVVPVDSSLVSIKDTQPIAIEPLSNGRKSFYSGVVAFFSLFVSNNNNISPAGITMKDAGPAATQLSAKDIINIALALISFGAFTWNQAQQALCAHDRQ